VSTVPKSKESQVTFRVGDKIPASMKVEIPTEKLIDYCLNLDHADGGPKAEVFLNVLGISSANYEVLQRILEKGVYENEISRVVESPYGTKIGINIPTPDLKGRTVIVASGWIDKDDGILRLTSSYIKKER